MTIGLLKSEQKTARSETEMMELWREISNAWKQMSRQGERSLSPLGIGMTEFKLLRILAEDGPTPMARLSDATILTQPAITSFVDKLENEGLVVRDRDQKDRRVIRISITAKGRALFRRALKIHSRFVTELLSALDQGELSRLASIMKKLSTVEVRSL